MAVTAIMPPKTKESSNGSSSSPPAKRAKTTDNEESPRDPYTIWFSELDQLPTKEGGILVQLNVASLMNGMSGKLGGVVDQKGKATDTTTITTPITTAGNITLDQLRHYATALKRAISTRSDRDVLTTTPIRIQQMLCPETLEHEFRAIRKRVYDTVILGKGLNQSEDGANDNVVTAARAVVHDAEKFKKCKVCQNNDQSMFVLDRKNGDVICSNCGTVAMESLMHEGSMYRKFEGEIDRNHHGDSGNPLLSNAANMSTTLGGMDIASSAGNGWGTQSRANENILRNAHAYTEMNISQFGEKDRRTRVGYKDKQKRDAFMQMGHVGDALNLHQAVLQRAKELFAGFRDDRELVQQFKGVVAACLCEAFEQLSRDGQQILKTLEQEEDTAAADTKGRVIHNSRASHRNDLHSAKMAGKGGLLLDFSSINGDKDTNERPNTPVNASEHKPAPTWDLDNCRSWLLDASRSIAKQWFDERQQGNDASKKSIPEGTLDELEGKLVEHTLTLCDLLEAELKAKNKNGDTGKRVVTPRVNDLGTLSIRWQHAHERGSGGKGGVGNSGRTTLGTKPGERRGGERTAGQVLILKTAKKLGVMLKDPVAGEAFHRELRALVGRQEARKRKEMRDEAARQRFQQMKRKPWLQARAQTKD